MALGFFRRHQKMVMIIMAILMVSFLVTYQGVQAIMDSFQANKTFGTYKCGNKDFNLTSDQYRRAQADLSVLGDVPQLAYSMLYLMQGQRPPTAGGMEYAVITAGQTRRSGSSEESTTAFALLVQEATQRGIQVSNQDVENYKVQELGLTGDRYKSLLERLGQQRANEQTLNQALHDLLLVYKSSETAAVNTPPSEATLRTTYQFYFEKIKLAMVPISAKDFIKNVTTQPTNEQIVEQFQKYRDQLPSTNWSDYGFGYKLPNRAQAAYLFVNRDVLVRAGEPTDQQVRDYRRNHKDELVSLPAPASRPAASSPTSGPDAEAQKVSLGSVSDFATVRSIVADKLAGSSASDMTDNLLMRVEELSTSLAGAKDPYGTIVARMIQPADDKLAMLIQKPIENVTLQQAMQSLSDEAGLANICLPWGKHGNVTIAPTLRVTVKATPGLTLRQALDQIVRQIGSFKIDRWVMCDRVDNVLFPLPPVGENMADYFPISAGVSGLLDMEGLAADPLLGHCSTTPDTTKGVKLVQMVFAALPFGVTEGQTQMNVGDAGPIMYITGDKTGRLVWKLADAKPASAPPDSDLLTNTKLHEQVVNDLNTVAAMKLADAQAVQLAKLADADGLEKAAAAQHLKARQTDFFSRDSSRPDISLLISLKPELIPYFVKQAFTLLPDNVEPTAASYPPSKAMVIALPGAREVVVVQRIGYQPIVQSDFQGVTKGPQSVDKNQIAQVLRQDTQSQTVVMWCTPKNVLDRLSFQRIKD